MSVYLQLGDTELPMNISLSCSQNDTDYTADVSYTTEATPEKNRISTTVVVTVPIALLAALCAVASYCALKWRRNGKNKISYTFEWKIVRNI